MTIGPVVLGASIATTSYVLSLSKGWITGTPVGTPGGIQFLINTVEFALMAGGMAALYHFVPNTRVRWTHALAGGVFGLARGVLLLFIFFALVPIIQAVVPIRQITDLLNASRLAPLFDSQLILSILGA